MDPGVAQHLRRVISRLRVTEVGRGERARVSVNDALGEVDGGCHEHAGADGRYAAFLGSGEGFAEAGDVASIQSGPPWPGVHIAAERGESVQRGPDCGYKFLLGRSGPLGAVGCEYRGGGRDPPSAGCSECELVGDGAAQGHHASLCEFVSELERAFTETAPDTRPGTGGGAQHESDVARPVEHGQISRAAVELLLD